MPNYVKNIVHFSGKKVALNNMVDFLKQGDRTELDFNRIIPESEDLTMAVAPCDETGVAIAEYLLHGTFECLGLSSQMFGTVKNQMESKLGQTYTDDRQLVKDYMIHMLKKPYLADDYWERCKQWYENLIKYGYTDWYTWRCDNWGTKWNACEADSLDVLVPVPLNKEESDPDCVMSYQFETAWSMPEGIYLALSAMFPDVTMEVLYADEDLGQNCGEMTYRGGGVIKEKTYDGTSKDSYEFAMMVWDEEYYSDFLKQDEDGHWYIDMDAYYESEEEK